MAVEQKKTLPQAYRLVDIDQYNFLRKKKGNEGFLKFLLFIVVVGFLGAYSFISFWNALQLDPNGFSAYLQLIGYVIVSVFLVLVMVALLGSKEKRLSNTCHLYTFKKEPGKYKIVDNFSGSSVSVSASVEGAQVEYDEDGNPIYYAEEVFDDEDNIFIIEESSTLIKKEKSITYADLVARLNESLESFGVTGDLAANLIASMAFSKLIDVTNVIDVIPTLFKALDNPNYVIHYAPNESLTSQRVLYNVFEYAKTHPTIPVFMLIDEIPSKEYLNFLRPLYRYIDDINGDYYININGVMIHIPHNIYFMTELRRDNIVFDISRRYLRYIAILKSNYQISRDPDGARKPCTITNDQLVNARRNAMESYAVEEATYKKLDGMFTLANEANGYVLQNKIQIKIEEFSAVLLSLEMTEEDVIDRCLAYNVVPAVVISSDPTKLMRDCNLTTVLDNEFGPDKMKLTKGVIKEYLSLFNSKGERDNG